MATASTALLPMPSDPVIAALTNGTYWQLAPNRVITWALANNPSFTFANPVPVFNAISTALGAIEQYINADFVYAGYYSDFRLSPAELTYTVLDGALAYSQFSPGALAKAVFPHEYFGAQAALGLSLLPSEYPLAEGDVFLNAPAMQSGGYANFWDGSAGKFVLVHETGHALGLKHPHDNGGTGSPTFADIGLSTNNRIEFSHGDGYDVDAFTAMSYNDDLSLNLWAGDPATLMPLDVLALQWLYGANPSTNAGDTTHVLQRDGAYRTIWDASGVDTLDASSSNYGWIIALEAQTNVAILSPHLNRLALAVPLVSGQPDQTTLRWVFDAENAIGSPYADLILGNDGPNVLSGNGGDDIVDGRGGNDALVGHFGNDQLYGGPGADAIHGSSGSDWLSGGSEGDVFLFTAATDSQLGAWDVISDFEFADRIVFFDISGVMLLSGAYAYSSNVPATVSSIQADPALLNRAIFFTDSSDGFLYVNGAGSSTSFDTSLIKLSGITTPPLLTQLAALGAPNYDYTFFDYDGGRAYVTLVANAADGQPDPAPASMATLSNVQQQDAPPGLPPSLHLPLGLISFQAAVSEPGKTESFSLYVDSTIPVDGFYKQDALGNWVNLASTVVHANGQTRVDFTITDGGQFDGDGLANGVIVDPGALGWADRPELTLNDRLLALYVAYFNRAPDADGMQFWQNVAQTQSLYQISAGFANHPRFAQEYGGLTNAQIAEKIYLNVLHRPGDADGIVFWETQLNSRPVSDIFVEFSTGAILVDLEGMFSRGELTADEYSVAFERQKISENLMQASKHFLELFGDATTPTLPGDQVFNDPAYQASIAVLKNVDSDLNLVFDQRDDLVPFVGLPDAMEQVVTLLG